MKNQATAEYKCSQKDLYEVCRIGWANFKKFDKEFNKLKGFYSIGFANTALSQIEIAEAMIDQQSYYEVIENNRIMLEVKSEACKRNFIKLKSYINTTYHDDFQAIMHEQAGLHFYKDATHQNWHALDEMNKQMKSFLSAHLTKLKSNTNIPALFETTCNDAIKEFTIAYDKYKNDLTVTSALDTKIRANNHLYRKLSVMFKDAKKVFQTYPELLALFNFEKILHSINTSAAKIKGLVTDEADTAINTAVIKIKYPDEPEIVLVVEEDGSYDTGSIKGGSALITVEAEGFAQVREALNIPKGAIISKNLRLMRGAA